MSSQEPVDLLSVGQNRRVYDCFNDRLEVEPYADISGIGAHVGYLGTAYLVIVILSGYYFLAFDPLRSPFTESEIPLHLEEESAGVEAEKRGIKRQWEPNPIDVACVGFCRRVFAKPARPSIHEQPSSQLEDAFHSSVLTLCDVQIATGTGILVSAYASLNGEEGISVYHWMIVIYLAWFANLTHLTGLTLLRPHLYRYSGERNWRMVFIVSLFVLLLVAQVPTIYFGAARYPAYARCFFDVRTVMKRMQLHDPYGHQYELVSAPAIVSMVLLALGFLTRIVKGSSRLSRNLGRLRRWASDIAQLSIHRIAGVSSSSEMFRTRPRLQQLWAVLVVRPLVAVFLTWRLYMDLCSSLLSEVR
ncbi:hypothetical protein QBC47DRAFT_442184 [Echria macrotheca]|uniref:Transmembrane protein n=1 Tax=Echria macrotheca TaxID=438768 RepID=A0AAJ0BFI1_9PEZI|nr:hypothetical protein QBC47DRAFT_442184 [Echria macrotheca]